MKYLMGGWVDTRIPDVSEHLAGLEIDKAAFHEWLSTQVGRYRSFAEIEWPTAETEKRELRRFIDALERLIPYTSVGGLPPIVKAEIWHESYKSGIEWNEMSEAVRHNLYRMQLIAEHVEAKIAPLSSRRGRKSRHWRDVLIRDLISKLRDAGATAADARGRAEAILILCQVDVPAGERAIRRIEKGQGDIN